MERLCIGLCVYNNEQGLPAVIRNLVAIKNVYKNTKFIFYYDHSEDHSLTLLYELKEKYDKDVHIDINRFQKSSVRTENIANARNGILNIIRTHYPDYEFFCMMDCNEYSCIGPIQMEVFEYVFSENIVSQWDSVSFDREAGYYDTWALSFDPYIYSFFHFHNWRTVVEDMRKVFNKMLNDYKENKPNEMIPVFSAFNGFAIYKTEKFLDCRYSADILIYLFPKGSIQKQINLGYSINTLRSYDDCEHRRFHLESIYKHNSRIMICTKSLFRKLENPPEGLRGPA